MVDPISTGANVALEASLRGYSVIALWCSEILDEFRSHVPVACKDLKYLAQVEEQATISKTAEAVKAAAGGRTIAACIVGGESGVTLADKLSLELGVRSNGVLPSGDRRNKSTQQRAVKAAGLRAVREALGKTWADVEAFMEKEPLPVVVKPVESAGSDGVKLCTSKAEAKAHLELLMDSQQRVGSQDAAVLVQEFLKGKEYVVDSVSRDGVHKTVMVWVYDKRPTNGSAFVYYGVIPVDSASQEAKILIPYVQGVLNALKLHNGPSHGEVMMTSDGPCLVEMNCRSHGWDGAWVPVCRQLTGGYAQPEVAVYSHVNAQEFAKIPELYPSPFKATGLMVNLVCFHAGTVRTMPGFEAIKKLPSCKGFQTGVEVGSTVVLTVDLFTSVGAVALVNADANQLETDLAAIRRLEKEGLFTFDEEVDHLQREGSSDEILAASNRRRGSSFDRERSRTSSMSGYDVKASAGAAAPPSKGLAAATVLSFAAGTMFGLMLARRLK